MWREVRSILSDRGLVFRRGNWSVAAEGFRQTPLWSSMTKIIVVASSTIVKTWFYYSVTKNWAALQLCSLELLNI